MKKWLLYFFLSNPLPMLFGQIPDGSIAPDFIAKDLDGNEYRLYDILASGRSVILDFSTTWCSPCWEYSQTGSLQDFYDLFGPQGVDESMIFLVECDPRTNIDDLSGLTTATQGDWIAETNYPILDNVNIPAIFQVNAYPTILMVCQDRSVQNIGKQGTLELTQLKSECRSDKKSPEINFYANKYDGCEALNVQFTDNSWPRPDIFEWDFGDGNTSNERHPNHFFDKPGNYTVKLAGTNSYGSNETVKTNLISVGSGNSKPNQKIGAPDYNIGRGRIFESGHHALIFDTSIPVVISSVLVFSSIGAPRTITLHDADGHLLNSKTIDISEGAHRIDLDFYADAGTGFQLGIFGEAYLFRNDQGTSFPYVLDDLLSIQTTTAGNGFYYYFYDWEVREAGCHELTDIREPDFYPIYLFPNPCVEKIKLLGAFNNNDEISIYNALGKLVYNEILKIQSSLVEIDVSAFSRGIYFFKHKNQILKFSKNN